MSNLFLHQRERKEYYMSKKEVYLLEYGFYHSGQIGFGSGLGNKSHREIYSNIEAAEKRMIQFQKKQFSGFVLHEINYHDWGCCYVYVDKKKPEYWVEFIIRFELIYDKPLKI